MKVQQGAGKKGMNRNTVIYILSGVILVVAIIFYGFLIISNTSSSEEDTLDNGQYDAAYSQSVEYAEKSGNDIGDIGYTAPLLANYQFYYPENDYSEQEVVDGLELFYTIFDSLVDNLQYYEEGEIYYLVEGNEDDEDTESAENSEDSVNVTIDSYEVKIKGEEIAPQEAAMMLEFALEVPRNESGQIRVETSLLQSIDAILSKYSATDEEYATMVQLIESSTYLNIKNDSEDGFNIPELNWGDVTINESDLASSKIGESYPIVDFGVTGNLNVCYQVTEDGNYAFSQAYDDEGESLGIAEYAVYDDYSDCIQSKYYLSKVPRQGYSEGKAGVSSADGTIKENDGELYEVQPLAAGEYVSVSGIKVQKYSDNKTLNNEE